MSGRIYDPCLELGETCGCGCHTDLADDVGGKYADDGRPYQAADWGVYGEANDVEAWVEFAEMLEARMVGEVPVGSLQPDAPEWDDPLPFARSAQKERGKTLFAHVGMTPSDMARLQGEIGARDDFGDAETADEFLASARDDDVEKYAEMFRDGQRPREFVVELEQTEDGPSLTTHQEGRHRALAAEKAGVDVVPAVILNTAPGEVRRGSWNEDHLAVYPEGDA